MWTILRKTSKGKRKRVEERTANERRFFFFYVGGERMEYETKFDKLESEIITAAHRFENSGIYDKALACYKTLYRHDRGVAYPEIARFRGEINKKITNGVKPEEMNSILKESYLMTAPDYFEDFCIFLEWNRPLQKRFYLPRRKQLKRFCDALQELAEGKISLLAISCPPGIGKTTLAIFYLCWLAGRNPELPILGGSHSNSFLRGVYDECLRVISGNGQEYLWKDVFHKAIVSTNAKDMRIDIDKPKRFETLEFSSIGSGNAGKVRAMGLLYCDDLVDGIETAMSKDRLDKLWQMYHTDLRQRKQGEYVRELHIATRWSVYDPIGRLQRQYEGDPRAKFLSFPAMDGNDESLWDYPFGLGFTTEFYREQREVMDDVSWKALYMNQPIEREGLLYYANELRRYFDLPTQEPDAIYAVCDTKDKGADYCVMPIAYRYGNDYYIDKIICDNSNPDVVEPRLIATLLERKVDLARFESNSAGGKIAQIVQEAVRKKGGHTKITTKFSTANKETRMIVDSAFAKERFLFKDESRYSEDREYRVAMQFLCSYTMAGKNAHDDVPDAMSMLVNFIESFDIKTINVKARPF